MADKAFDAVIVGAGFSGLYMLHRLRGLGLTARVFEAGDGVGGTWYWNRYPGARVDIESQEYSYSFSPELEDDWAWTERYAAQPELLRYANHVADRFDLRKDIQFETRVTSAVFDEAASRWTVTTDRGETVTGRFCIMATGCLSSANDPQFPGLESFQGPTYHTGRWPHEGVDFTGKRVAVIGTGSSAIQSIPEIARQAARLTVFQRTPNYSVPAHNGPLDPKFAADWKANRARHRAEQRVSSVGFIAHDPNDQSALEVSDEERQAIFEDRWRRGGFSLGGAFNDIGVNMEANLTAQKFVAEKIREIVKDPKTAEALVPKTYPFGTKRLCIDTGYYATFNRDNVELVDLRETPIEAITPAGVRTSAKEYPADAIVFAIGFDAMTGALNRIDIRGREGKALKDVWADGPKTYLGLMVAGFPNLFTITGPGSPSVLSNMIVSIEQHVDWITDCLAWLGQRQASVIEATPEAQEAWVAHVNEVADTTLYPLANSWYIGANVPGKPRVFMPYVGGVGLYRERCDAVAANDYEGFEVRSAAS
ncbi:flavin-containing monooxygenase [Phenylobacterium montanum]|uniref:NAD(P)/FAD-dependent oxidoreductase n=1 Tax=Phenylobacterium montanum TaxID=2823693 RepID=A0A975FVS0_9CAUL|nr:NAD(P)/FAD-dependent oxidoreductase [Caulobacter sp. S6]QUD86285.1 NAD(P)/FAD-dependent oxidoreductase [Caulobacter sp. S6]